MSKADVFTPVAPDLAEVLTDLQRREPISQYPRIRQISRRF